MQRGFKCECCGRSGEDVLLEVHHIAPVATNPELIADFSNLKLLCRSCHKQIHSNHDIEAPRAIYEQDLADELR